MTRERLTDALVIGGLLLLAAAMGYWAFLWSFAFNAG